MGLIDNIRKGIRTWLLREPSTQTDVNITDYLNFDLNCIKNRLWYIGNSDDLSQFYSQLLGMEDTSRFWAARNSAGRRMRKLHVGIPGITVDTLTNIIATDFTSIELSPQAELDWDEIAEENDFKDLLQTSVKDALALGDGAFKVSIDPEVSEYPIIEWFGGDRVRYVYQRGRLQEIIFLTTYIRNKKHYVLWEHYSKGRVWYELRNKDGTENLPLDTLPECEGLKPVSYAGDYIMGVPLKIFKSSKFPNRGKSIFDAKTDCYDALDETFSQWMQALRDGRSTKYVPECLLPRDPETGVIQRPNPFDNQYIATDSDMSEGSNNHISVIQPVIPHDSYMATYITALDMCLQGIISPSTVGIDVKKLDNAESQREKEKTTLYTRGKIIDALQQTIPQLIQIVFNALSDMRAQEYIEVEASINFGDYANPSFESQIETLGKAKMQGVMSNEALVEDLYGDTKDDDWKQEEIARLNAKDGIGMGFNEPMVSIDGEGV